MRDTRLEIKRLPEIIDKGSVVQEKPFKCEICPKSFTFAAYLCQHQVAVHDKKNPHECDICNQGFALQADLKIHFASVHEGKKSFLCQHCDDSFGIKQHLDLRVAFLGNDHISMVHDKKKTSAVSEQTTVDKEQIEDKKLSPVREGKKQHFDEICENNFATTDSLKVHMVSAHEGKKCHTCGI